MSDHESSMEIDIPEDSGKQSSATRLVVSQSTANKILRQRKKMKKSLEREIQANHQTFRGEPASSTQERMAELRTKSWANREVEGSESYFNDLSWPISKDEREPDNLREDNASLGTTISQSEDSSRLVALSVTKVLAPDDWKKLRNNFPCPEMQEVPQTGYHIQGGIHPEGDEDQ